MPVRVGILGAAGIAYQVWEGIQLSGNRVTYVGCREAARGEEFVSVMCKQLDIAAAERPAVGTYEDVVSSDAVDVVYIPIPVTARDYWVKQCVEHEKHVVGEKPSAVDAEELRGWIEALDSRGLFYMDGCMFSHTRRIERMAEAARALGPIKYIHTRFSFPGGADFFAKDIRLNPALEPHGALGDLGWYNIRLILHMMNFEMPTEVTGRVLRQNDKGAVVALSGQLVFHVGGNTTLATLYTAFDTAGQCSMKLIAAHGGGLIELPDFTHPISGGRPSTFEEVHPTLDVSECRYDCTRAVTPHVQEDEVTITQKVLMWKDVDAMLVRGDGGEKGEGKLRAKAEESRKWATYAWKTQAIMDKLLQSARQSQAQ